MDSGHPLKHDDLTRTRGASLQFFGVDLYHACDTTNNSGGSREGCWEDGRIVDR